MAFIIQRGRGSLPGRSAGVTFQADLSTGGAQKAQAVGELAGAVQNTAIVANRLEAEAASNEGSRQIQEALDRFQDKVEQEPDSKLYDGFSKETQQELDQIVGGTDNNLAKRALGFKVNTLKAGMANTVLDMRLARGRDTKRADVETNVAAGRFDLARKGVMSGMGDGSYTKQQGAVRLANLDKEQAAFINKEEFVSGQRFAMRDPNMFLNFVEGDKVVGLGLDTLTPGQVQALRATAEGTERFNLRQNDEETAAQLDEVFKDAATSTPGEMHARISQMPIDGKEKAQLFSGFMSAYRSLKVDDANPWTSTSRDGYSKVVGLMERMDKGETFAPTDFYKEMFSDPDAGPSFSMNHLLLLRNMNAQGQTTSVAEYKPTHPIAKASFEELRAIYGPDDEPIPPEFVAEYVENRFKLDSLMKANWDTPQNIGKIAENLLVEPRREQAKRRWLSAMLGALIVPGSVPIPKITGGQPLVIPGVRPRRELPTPTTQEDYEKLPAGAAYIHPDGGIKVKE